MRVKIGEKDYIVSFQKETFASVKVNKPEKELHHITCRIYSYNLQTKVKTLLAENTVSQNYKDKTNDVLGRKIAFTRTLNTKVSKYHSVFEKEERIAFWNEYKKTARYIVK